MTQTENVPALGGDANLPAHLANAKKRAPKTMSPTNIVIPKIWAMQHMSEKVINKEAEYGQFRDSMNNALLGDLENPVEFIPFDFKEWWIIEEKVKDKYKYKEKIAINRENDAWRYDFEGGRRIRVIDIYCMVPGHMKICHIISFKVTSLRAGKKVLTQFAMNQDAGAPVYASVMKLKGTSTTNDDGTFVVLDTSASRYCSEQEAAACEKWLDRMENEVIAVDDSDLKSEAAPKKADDKGQF